MNKPEIKYTTNHGYEITLNDTKQLVISQGTPCINGGKIKHNGKTVKLMIRLDNKPELAALVETWKVELAEFEADTEARFAENVPGLNELKAAQEAAYNEDARYSAQFSRMMDSGDCISPIAVDKSLQEKADSLATEYPRAAMYLKAQSYTYASNHHKYGAGKDAQAIIATGGSLQDAEEVLNNWLPEEAIWN